MVLGPTAFNYATGKVERMVEEEYEVKVYERPAECYNCIQDTGSHICKSSCFLWEDIRRRRDDGMVPYVLEKRTRWVFAKGVR